MENKKNLAVISTWLRCIDGVSIEADKWTKVYNRLGFNVHLVAGRMCAKTSLPRCIIPKMDFMHPNIRLIKKMAFESYLSEKEKEIFMNLVKSNVAEIKPKLRKYLQENNIEVVSAENTFSLPYNIPMAIALKEVIEELNLPCILRHHDFYWERDYFTKRYNIPEILGEYFPPKNLNAVHIAINRNAYAALLQTKGIKSIILPDYFDFDNLKKSDSYNKDFRKDLGIGSKDLIFLQPTRIVSRKRIERTVRLIYHLKRILNRECVLVITGPPLYPNELYVKRLFSLASELGVRIITADNRVNIKRGKKKGRKIYSIGDAYINTDVVALPSEVEGFGLPVLEACAYKKPLFVNNFPVLREITEKGFDFVVMRGELSNKAINKMQLILTDSKKRKEMVEKNYKLLQEHYALKNLEKEIKPILEELMRNGINRVLRRFFSLFAGIKAK